jgi:membrane protease YdiL (CAAX protease family)
VSLKAVVILLSVLLGLARVWSHRRRGMGPLLALGLPLDRRELGNAVLGAAIGVFAIGTTFLVAYTTRHVEVVAVGPPAPLVNDIMSFLAVPFVEELLFRSALLGGLLVVLPPNHKWVAVTCSAVVFGALHALNEHATLLAVLGSTLGGLSYGIAFATTQKIWLSFGLHFGWNYAIGPLFGFPISGGIVKRGTFVHQHSVGASWFTGGDYGPEGGVLGMVGRVLVLALVLVWLADECRRQSRAAARKRRAENEVMTWIEETRDTAAWTG